MIRIAHASDTHNHPEIITAIGALECDIIVLTGDILDNRGRMDPDGRGYRIFPRTEVAYQKMWFHAVAKDWAKAFRNRPVIYVPGNHDFIGIEPLLRENGHTNITTINRTTPSVEVFGRVFAGFREIPYMKGEWMGEAMDLAPCVDRAMACDPDILVTHAPPGGILDGPNGYGIPGLTSALFYGSGKVTHHLFGHAHEHGGQIRVECDVTFSNAAGHVHLLDLD